LGAGAKDGDINAICGAPLRFFAAGLIAAMFLL
jgi:hypothetical protein